MADNAEILQKVADEHRETVIGDSVATSNVRGPNAEAVPPEVEEKPTRRRAAKKEEKDEDQAEA
jgi:hypothetical protein